MMVNQPILAFATSSPDLIKKMFAKLMTRARPDAGSRSKECCIIWERQASCRCTTVVPQAFPASEGVNATLMDGTVSRRGLSN